MMSLTLNAAISNKIASGAILHFDAVNFCDAAGSATATQHHAIVLIFAHIYQVKKFRQQTTKEEDSTP